MHENVSQRVAHHVPDLEGVGGGLVEFGGEGGEGVAEDGGEVDHGGVEVEDDAGVADCGGAGDDLGP